MKKLTFQQKLWIPMLCALVCISGMFPYFAIQTYNMRLEERRNDLSNIGDVALNAVKKYAELSEKGALTKFDAQRQALAMVKNLRYGTNGYIEIIDLNGINLMNPFNPELNGKDMTDFQDVKGKFIYQEFTEIGKTESGSGFVHYHWTRPEDDTPVPKLSRVVTYKPWEWNIVTGLYTDDIDAEFRGALLRFTAALLAILAGLIAITLFVNRSLRRTLGGAPEYAAQVVTEIAANNLGVEVKIENSDTTSLLFAMNSMQTNLAGTIGRIRHDADAIAMSSAELAAGNMALSARTESQASALEETASTVEEIFNNIERNADNVQHANRAIQVTAEAARQSGHIVANVIETMEAINTSAARITDIIGVIDGIAFQTNILALNAAVEAARAGEQGRGFAVVASEVRSLAGRSADAAKEVKILINNSSEQIEIGNRRVVEAGTAMDAVVSSIFRMTEIMSEIATASNDQKIGIGQINQAVSEIDSATQQNAALVEQAAAAAASMQELAVDLTNIVSQFRLGRSSGI